MKNSNRKIAVLLLLVTIMLMFASCAEESSNTSSTGTEISSADTEEVAIVAEETKAETEGLLDDLGSDLDFEGTTITYYSRQHFRFTDEVTVDELTGDLVNDAIFNREQTIEDRLNVNIENVKDGDQHGAFGNMEALIHAGDDSYDIFTSSMYTAAPGSINGIFYDLNEIPYIDLSKPYYTQDYIKKSSIANRTYTVTGDMSLSLIRYSFCMYFNKLLIDEYQMESPYTMVREGTWTHDKLRSIVSDIYVDLNNNAVEDNEDFYGLGTSNVIIVDAYTSSYDMTMYDIDDAGIPSLSVDQEKFATAVQKIYELNWNTNGVRAYVEISDNNEMTDLCNFFSQDHIVFMHNWIYGSETEYLRSMESDFGIIPYPKYDELQENYYTFQHDQIGVFAIPITSKNAATAGAVIEAMSSESRYSVVPTYYDLALKNKYSRDADSAEMIDIIHNNHKLDIGWIYCLSVGDLAQMPRNLMLAQNADFASQYASKQKVFKKKLEILVKKCTEG